MTHPASRSRYEFCLWRRLAAAAALLLCLASPATSAAQDTDGEGRAPPPPEAIEAYNRGRDHYQAGRYRDAVMELERALELDPGSPNLAYNVARVYELLGNVERAIEFYQRYRSMLPPTEREERERVAAILLRLEGARNQVAAPTTAPPTERLRTPESATQPIERGVADGAFWWVTGTALAAVAAGAVTGAFALKVETRTKRFVVGANGSADERADLMQRADRLALTTDVMLMVGATLGVTGILLYALRQQPVERSTRRTGPRLALGASRGGLSLSIRGSL